MENQEIYSRKRLLLFHIILWGLASNSILGQSPLVQLVYSAEEILLARYVDHLGDSLIFVSKDFHSRGGFDDTIVLLQSQAFRSIALNKEDKEIINKNIITSLEQSRELLFFVHSREGQLVFPFYGGIRIATEHDVRWTYGPWGWKDLDFMELLEKITWEEMLQRVVDIQSRLEPVYALGDIKNPKKRNIAFFQWLEDHMDEYHLACDLNADCGWGSFQDVVMRWIIDANILEDTWKVAEIYSRIYGGDARKLDGYLATFMDPSAAFKSGKGLQFLLEKALNEDHPILDRQHALIFMSGALSFILNDTFHDDSYFKKRSQFERQQDFLDQLMPLMYDDQLDHYTFSSIAALSHSEVPEWAHRINHSKVPEMMQIYKTQSITNLRYKERFTDFLLASCTLDQWKSITGNDTLMHVSLYLVYYNESTQQLRFSIAYKSPEGFVREKPNVQFEKWEDGVLVDSVIKEFSNVDGSIYRPVTTYISQVVDMGDLGVGEWVFYLDGVAGDKGQYRWTSDREKFEKR